MRTRLLRSGPRTAALGGLAACGSAHAGEIPSAPARSTRPPFRLLGRPPQYPGELVICLSSEACSPRLLDVGPPRRPALGARPDSKVRALPPFSLRNPGFSPRPARSSNLRSRLGARPACLPPLRSRRMSAAPAPRVEGGRRGAEPLAGPRRVARGPERASRTAQGRRVGRRHQSPGRCDGCAG